MAAAIHLALVCLVLSIWTSYPKGVGKPSWLEPLGAVLAWPLYFLFNNRITNFYIGIVMSFLWAPAVALCAVKVCMMLKRKDTEPSLGTIPHDPAGRSDVQG